MPEKIVRVWDKTSIDDLKNLRTLDKRRQPDSCPMGIAQNIMSMIKTFANDQCSKMPKQNAKKCTNDKNKFLKLVENELSKFTYESERDGMTNLLNEKSFEARARGILNNNFDFCFFVIDLNNLKKVNDSLGHIAGDNYILSLSRTIRTFAPVYRITPGRCGGDEFYMIMPMFPTIKNRDEYIRNMIKSLREDFVKNWTDKGYDSSLASFSIGWHTKIALDKDERDIYKALLKRADRQMYEDKISQKGGFSENLFFDEVEEK